MQRIHSVEPKTAQGRTKELLDTVQQAFGMIPNTAKVMANSPAVLDSGTRQLPCLQHGNGESPDRWQAAQPTKAHDE